MQAFKRCGAVEVERMGKKIHKEEDWENESSPSSASQRHTSTHCMNECQGSTQK